MSEYIKREDAIELVLEPLSNMPSEDVVKVVRCKDCKQYMDWLDGRICARLGSYYGDMNPDDFCSYGEEKE